MSARISSLDGLRAFSICLVLLGHLAGTHGSPVPTSSLRWFPSGHLGVRVFFVISGFLITTLLLRELESTGRIDLGRFYLRRTFRIFPAFYVFIACLVLGEALGWVSLRQGDILHAVTYTMNYHWDRAWPLGHLWSLSVEEQFYLLWPLLLLLAGAKGGVRGAVGYILLAPLVRVGTWVFLEHARVGIGETFETTADSIAVGCALAHFRNTLGAAAWYQRLHHPVAMLGVMVAVYLADHFGNYPSFSLPVGETLTNIGIALCIDWCLRNPGGVVGRVLNLPVIVYVGQLSYSLYLWQQPFLNRESDSALAAFPVNLACAFACALASYYLIEKPFLRWRSIVEDRLNQRGAAKSETARQ